MMDSGLAGISARPIVGCLLFDLVRPIAIARRAGEILQPCPKVNKLGGRLRVRSKVGFSSSGESIHAQATLSSGMNDSLNTVALYAENRWNLAIILDKTSLVSATSELTMQRELEDGLITDLTVRQEEVLDFIEDFIVNQKMPPTRKEIADGFGWKSPNAAEQVLRRLEKLGRITITPSVSRGIRLSDEWRLADR